MNKRDTADIGDLPQPTSPAALDQRILAHARAQAPAKPNHWRSPWVGGLATASIVTVALLIANPWVQVPESGPAAIPMEEQAAYEERRELEAPSSHYDAGLVADIQHNEAPLKTEPSAMARSDALAAPARKAKPKPVNSAKEDHATAQSPRATQSPRAAESPRAVVERRAALADEQGIHRMRQQQADTAASAEQSMAQAIGGATASRPSKPGGKQNSLKKILEEKDDFEADAAPSTEEALILQLRDLQEIFASGKEDLAREDYQTLRENCVLCELPPTLELAIKQLTEREKPAEE